MSGNFNDQYKRDLLYSKAVKHFGFNNQIIACIEELSELNVELSKILIGKRKIKFNENDFNKLIDELADSKIMLEQMTLNFKCREEVRLRMSHKLSKLDNLINMESEK